MGVAYRGGDTNENVNANPFGFAANLNFKYLSKKYRGFFPLVCKIKIDLTENLELFPSVTLVMYLTHQYKRTVFFIVIENMQ